MQQTVTVQHLLETQRQMDIKENASSAVEEFYFIKLCSEAQRPPVTPITMLVGTVQQIRLATDVEPRPLP